MFNSELYTLNNLSDNSYYINENNSKKLIFLPDFNITSKELEIISKKKNEVMNFLKEQFPEEFI